MHQRSNENKTPPFPRFAEWLSTFRCDLRCSHCAASAGEAIPNELSHEEAVGLLDKLAELGVEHLCISGGEPTTRSDWLELLTLALDLFEKIHLISNGRLGHALSRALEGVERMDKLTLALSIDGPEPVHDARRGSGSYRRVREVLDRSDGVAKEVITTVARDNLDSVGSVARLCLESGVRWWTLQPALPLGRLGVEDTLGPGAPRQIAELIEELKAKLPDDLAISTSHPVMRVLGASEESERWPGCTAAKEQIIILPDGGVTGCVTMDDAAFGNVRERALRDIWDSEMMASARERCATGGEPCRQFWEHTCSAPSAARRGEGKGRVP